MSPIDALEDFLASQILPERAYTQYRAGKVSASALEPYAEAIRHVSAAYVTHDTGSTLTSPINSRLAAEAYALYYTPINAAKILHLLPLLSFDSPAIQVLDVGCGPGTAGLALLSALSTNINLTCVETSPEMRAVAEQLLSRWSLSDTLHTLDISRSLSLDPKRSFDVIICANVLAELREKDAMELLLAITDHLTPRGYLLLLEPGQQSHTRRLMGLRDWLVARDRALVPQFPCLRSDRCPMLSASSTDWCHDTLEWRQPRLHAQFDSILGFNKHRIKYSAFLFQKNGALKEGVRVLTPPTKTRQGVEALICGKDLYGITRVRKGLRSANTRPFEKADVFDRLLMAPARVGDLSADTVITRALPQPQLNHAEVTLKD